MLFIILPVNNFVNLQTVQLTINTANDTMRIIIVGTAYPYRGGLAAYSERLAREYMNEGHEVEIITFTLHNLLFIPRKTQYSSNNSPPTEDYAHDQYPESAELDSYR